MVWVIDDLLLDTANEVRITHYSDTRVAEIVANPHIPTRVHKLIEPFYNLLRSDVYAMNKVENLLNFVDTVSTEHSVLFIPFTNPLEDSVYIEFINESLDFLETGKRKTDLMVYNNILPTYATLVSPMIKVDVDEVRQLAAEKKQLSERTKAMNKITNVSDLVSYINMWCSHRGGFRDLVITLYLLHRDYAYGATQY